jgi:hypothetical protein
MLAHDLDAVQVEERAEMVCNPCVARVAKRAHELGGSPGPLERREQQTPIRVSDGAEGLIQRWQFAVHGPATLSRYVVRGRGFRG